MGELSKEIVYNMGDSYLGPFYEYDKNQGPLDKEKYPFKP